MVSALRLVLGQWELDMDKVTFLFVSGLITQTDANSYLGPRLKGETKVLSTPKFLRSLEESLQLSGTDDLLPPDKTKLLYYINKMISVYHLYISPSVASDILVIAYKKKHLGFSHCYKIIIRSWFIRGLIKMLQAFICHYLQCLAL